MDRPEAESILRDLAVMAMAACDSSGIDHASMTVVTNDEDSWWMVSYSADGGMTTISFMSDGDE